jgi:enoyl-CoA hydratase
MWGHPDQEEGPRAFAERRDAAWRPLEPHEEMQG